MNITIVKTTADEAQITAIEGAAWGDEGKGKIATRKAKNAKLVIRATGGANAGHTIVFNGHKIILHILPGGIVYEHTICLIGQGVVIDLLELLEEITQLEKIGVKNVRGRLKISGRAHIVFPYHKALDALHEIMKDKPVGTTKQGIGPTYADKANRTGIRIYDLLLPQEALEQKIAVAVKLHNQLFECNEMEEFVVDTLALITEYGNDWKSQFKDMVVNADLLVKEFYERGDRIVVEGAQAYRLDLDNGDYPNVTSSNCATFGTLNGAHLSPQCAVEVILCVKAHASRVGNGPFPTELPAHVENNQVLAYLPEEAYAGDIIREEAHEYGATTKRPRRVGWFDAVLLRSAKWTMGADYLCVNHLDTMGKIGELVGYVNICTQYEYRGQNAVVEKIDYYPDDIELTGEVPTPVYTTLQGGWKIPQGVQNYDELPEKAKQFIQIIEETAEIPIKYIGIGPGNEDLIER